MKSAFTKHPLQIPDTWQDLPMGEQVKGLVEAALVETSRKLFGYHLVRLGNLSSEIQLPECPIKHQVNVTPLSHPCGGVTANATDLPFAENSVDAFLLANELDFARDPHKVLREVDRTIMPDGHVVITGFNPLSVCGLFKYLPVNRQNVLHDARFFSFPRVKDWLQLLGFEVISSQHILFNELFLERRILSSTKWSMWCNRHLGLFSTMYVIVARKREIPLSLIKPKWKTKRKFSAVGASIRSSSKL